MRTRRPLAALLATLAVLASGPAAAHCFMVYDPQQRLVYQSTEAPFDLSVPLSQGLAANFPRHHMVMTQSSIDCAQVDTRAKATLALPQDEARAAAAGKRPARRTNTAPAAR